MQILRWLAFLPGSILASWIVYMIAKILWGFEFAPNQSSFWLTMVDCASHYMMGFAFVYCGIKIAPSYKRHVAFFLATIGIMFTGGTLFLSLFGYGGYKTVLAAIACTGGIVTCLWQFLHDPYFS